jgi:hypothetical protein
MVLKHDEIRRSDEAAKVNNPTLVQGRAPWLEDQP